MGYQTIFNKITHANSLIEPSYKTTFQETALQRQLKQNTELVKRPSCSQSFSHFYPSKLLLTLISKLFLQSPSYP